MEHTRPEGRLLLVEDDTHLGYLLKENLEAAGFAVSLAVTGTEGIRALDDAPVDLCILDVMLPEADGFAVAQHLRKQHPRTPFLFLTARMQESDRLHGFALGADDYVGKPFSFKELHCRIEVVLRRSGPAPQHAEAREMLRLGGLCLHPQHRTLSVQGKARKLSQRESQLLQMLLEQCGSYIPRSEILERLWGRDDYFTAKSMDVYLTRIRKLIKDDPSLEIENLYGSGYRIKLSEDAV
jgi:DNA-binding response OmpR family regulator